MLATGFQPVDTVLLVVILALLAISGVLALAETSLTRTGRVKAKALLDDHRRGAKPLVRLVEHPERFLNPILLLVLICQLVSATLVGVLADQWLGAIGVVVATVFEIVVIFVVFEAIPKNWAVHNPERAALFSAPLVAAVVRFPPVRLVSALLIGLANLMIGRDKDDESTPNAGVTESELRAMADVAHAEDVIETAERAFIHSIIDFGDTVVREVMVPRPDMVTLETDDTVTEALEAALAAGYSRLPVYRHNVDDVIGIAYTKDLMRIERAGRGTERPTTSPRPSAWRACCARCRTASSTSRSWSTNTAERPAWSRWRTSSKSWSARSSTSSTWRSRRSSAGPTGASSWPGACRSARPTSSWTPSCPRGPGTRSAASCSTWRGACRARVRRSRWEGSAWWPSGCRAAESAGCASSGARWSRRRAPGTEA